MRIAMVGPFGLHPNKTMSSRALGLARPLAAQEHQVKVFMPPWHTPDEADRSWQEDDIELRYTMLSGGVMGTSRNLVKETVAWDPDVVHCFKPKAYSGLVAWWLWQFHRQKIRLVVDSDDWEGWGGWNERAPYTSFQKHFFAWQETWGMSHCHYLTVASKALESIALSQGIRPDKVVYLPNGAGILVSEQALPDEAIRAKRKELGTFGRPTLLLYSRLFEVEIGRLVEFLAGVKASVPDLAVLSIGEALYSANIDDLQGRLKQAGLKDAMIDLGWVALDKLPLLLKAADLGIYLMDDTLLNRTKCPVKLADMTAVGLAVIAENVGQVPEYVQHGKTGYLRPSGDVQGLIDDTVYLLRHDNARKQMATAAKTHYQANFAWDKLAGHLEHVYG
jgi:glycosyltransferase involved in cell wall biosynthesis